MSEEKPKIIEGFDCIAFKSKVQEKIYQATKDMTPEQELEYIHCQVHEGEMGEIWRKFEKKPAAR
jgi:hypothetical protein